MKRKILRGLFITQYKERKEGETRWNGVPSAERWASHAKSSPFPERQRSLCYPGFWPRQETPDPSFKAGELKQAVPRWKDLNGTHICQPTGVGWGMDRAVCVSAEVCLGRGLLCTLQFRFDLLHLVRTRPLLPAGSSPWSPCPVPLACD